MSGLRRMRCMFGHLSGFQQQQYQSGLAVRRHQGSRSDMRTCSVSSTGMPFGAKPSPALHITPKSGMADGLLDVRASGLLPGQLVALQAEVDSECRRYKFQSRAMFQADMSGQVIVSEQASLGGTYEGVEPMGLIWSCQPAPEFAHRHPRLKKENAGNPLYYTFRLLDRSGPGEEAVLGSEVIERLYVADYVDRTKVNYGKSEGVWFIPKQKGSSDPLPVVVELRGLGNGAMEDRASLLASHGYAVYAMDFMKSFVVEEQGMKDTFYFDSQAILDVFDFIKNHPRLDESRVGMFGFCTGAALAIHGLSRLNLPIRCAIFSSMIEVFHSVVAFKMPDGKLLHTLGDLEEFTEIYEVDGRTWFRCKDTETLESFIKESVVFNEDTFPPVQNISVPCLFIMADDDQYQPSREQMLTVMDSMRAAGKGHLIQTQVLTGTGHLLDAPYLPICTRSSIKFPTVPKPYFTTWGGTPKPYAHSLERSWKEVREFYEHHLSPLEQYR